MAALALAACLVAASCSSSEETGSVDDAAPLAAAFADTNASQSLSTTTETTAAAPDTSLVRVYPDYPALNDGESVTTTTTSGASVQPSGGAPQSDRPRPTVGSPTLATGGPTDGYAGVLGTYSVNQVLSTSPIPAPVTQPGTAPLTGLPGGNGSPAVIVKIDNSSKARPQAGLNAADVVIEEEVEWGITRFAAIFHTDHTAVGPVRSGRSTDISFLSSLGNPALVYSGANDVFDALILNQSAVRNFSAARNGGYWRQSGRRAPSNLFADTNSFVGSGAQPPAWFAFRAAGSPSPGTPTSRVNVTWPNTRVVWNWDGSAWLRSQNGSAHQTTDGGQANAANIVVAETAVMDTGLRDSAGGVVPEYVWAGSGPVTVFTDGKRIDGTWYRPTLGDPAILVAGDGSAIELTPGRTWVEIVSQGLLSSS